MIARRHLLAAAAALAATAQRPELAHAQTTELAFWNFFEAGDGSRMEKLVSDFNESQDRVRVRGTTLQWGTPFYTKLRTAILAGSGPDLFTFHLSLMPGWGSEDLLRPISAGELDKVGLKAADFYPRLWEKAQAGGELRAVPLDTHPLVLYVNLDLAGRAGLVGADGELLPITSMEAFDAAVRKVKSETGAYGVNMESDPKAFSGWRIWSTFVNQQGQEVVRDEQPAWGESGKLALRTMTAWVQDGVAPAQIDYQTHLALFLGGQVGFMLTGVWERPTFVDATEKGQLPFSYRVMPLPKFYQQQVNWADSHGLALPGGATRPAPGKVEAALEFIAYVQKNGIVWAEGGHLPAYRPVAASPEFAALKPNASYLPAAERVVYDPSVWYAGAAGPLQDIAHRFINASMNGQMPVDQALAGMEAEIRGLRR